MSSRFGRDGYTNSQRKRITKTLETSVKRDAVAIEAMQQRLVELGAERMTEDELNAMSSEGPLPPAMLPQPKGRWLNGKFIIPA